MLQILEMKLREIRHNIFGYMSYAPSYSSATPFLRQGESTSPPPPYNFPSLVIKFTILHPTTSPPSPTRGEHPALLPSKGENHPTPPPPFSCASCYNNGNKRTSEPVQAHPHISRRDKPPLPFL